MIDDEKTRSGTMPRDKKSNRIGTSGGRAARTFHCKFGSQRVGSGKRAGAVDYLAREGHYTDRDDLEHVTPADERESFLEATEAIEAAARIKTGPQAERVMVSLIVELPMDTTRGQRAAMMEEIAGIWRDKGHLVVGAVHGNDQVQPHVHLAITARPVTREGGEWLVDRTPGNIPCTGIQALRDARGSVAEAINRVMDGQGIQAPRFHGGRLKDTGIERPAKVRLPLAEYYRETRGEDSFTRTMNRQIEAVIEAEATGKRFVQTLLELGAELGPNSNSISIRNARIAWGEKQRKAREARKAEREKEARKAKDAPRKAAAKALKEAKTETFELRMELHAAKKAAGLAPPRKPSEKQLSWIQDAHARAGIPVPDLTTHEGLRQAFDLALGRSQDQVEELRQVNNQARKREENKVRENQVLKAQISTLEARLAEQVPRVPKEPLARPGACDGLPEASVTRGPESLQPQVERGPKANAVADSGSPAQAKGIPGMTDEELKGAMAKSLKAAIRTPTPERHAGLQALAGEIKRRRLKLDPETNRLMADYSNSGKARGGPER